MPLLVNPEGVWSFVGDVFSLTSDAGTEIRVHLGIDMGTLVAIRYHGGDDEGRLILTSDACC
jgi:hypothetical protein